METNRLTFTLYSNSVYPMPFLDSHSIKFLTWPNDRTLDLGYCLLVEGLVFEKF
jgi:hypothetical protein